MKKQLLVITALLACAACSRLKVEVDVADPAVLEQWNRNRVLTEGSPRVISEPPDSMRTRVHALKMSKLQQFFAAHSAEYDNLAHRDRQKVIDRLEKQFDQTTGKFYDYHGDVLESLGVKIREAQEKLGACEEEFRVYAVNLENAAANAKAVRKQNGWLKKSTAPPGDADHKKGTTANADAADGQVPFIPKPKCSTDSRQLTALLLQRERMFADAERGPDFVLTEPAGPLTSLVGQDGLFREPEAFTIANAPEDVWKKNFDRSYSWSLFGDTNVAIKMESRGNFSIKGVSFDPSEVTRVASKVVTQSLLAWTQIAGVPATAAARRPGSIPVVMAENDRERMLFESDRIDQMRALLAVADAVGGAEKRLGDEASRANATRALVAVWEANKERVLHAEQRPAGSQLTLAPAEVTVAPGESFKLFPALAAPLDRTVDVAFTVSEPQFTDFPKFVTIPSGQDTAQKETQALDSAPWKDYTVTATLGNEAEQATVHVAPKFVLEDLPNKLLVDIRQTVERETPAAAPEGSEEPKPEVTDALGAENVSFANKQLKFDLFGIKEGSGTVTIVTGGARSAPKTITIVKPVMSADSVSIVNGQKADVTLKLDRKGGIGTYVTKLKVPESALRIDGDSTITWGTDDAAKVVRVEALKTGTHALVVETNSGDDASIIISVVATVVATPATLSGDAEEEVVLTLQSGNLDAATKLKLSVADATIARVDDEATLPANGEAVEVTVTLLKAGKTDLIVEKEGAITKLRVPVTVTATADDDNE